MRDVYISHCEKDFLQKIVTGGRRLDGRNYNESRKLNISFGSEYGSCIVSLGETKVLSQVSCEVVQPKQIRPNEGILFINVEITPIAGQQFEANRQTDLTVYLNRLLEKCYKDSKCIDLESLCIVVEEKVWSLRVDLKVLNHEGNLIECASIATLTSLAHFKRPDVTRSGDKVIIHTLAEKDPIPTVLYHYPVCLTFAIFNDLLISDPNFLEESVCMSNMDEGGNRGGILVVGMNQYKELCLLDLTGAAIENSNIVHRALLVAADRCKELVDLVKSTIVDDDTARQKRVKKNFSDIITTEHMLSLNKKDLSICLKNYHVEDIKSPQDEEMEDEDVKPEPSKYDVVPSLPQTAEIVVQKGASTWIEISSGSEED
ncbi:exosome complex component RRP45 isoform X1 [Papilio machaon]|uniref:exosome complex component RRP45 isoform X1 n=1 Tax=Papilio machaon TaxID=76193 RepID=UPI001E6630F4|nr:exosome complex component RRP45 isoform X1 [Papilio machaon]